MVRRDFWLDSIERAWKRRSVVWLSGVRRSGKTSLLKLLSDVDYYDCELPRTRRLFDDPEAFLRAHSGRRIALDEIHRLADPASLLKIAADHFADTHLVATGSSTLGASTKFRDTLTGRKTDLWLTPMIETDLANFGEGNLRRRLLHGGLPPFFLSDPLAEHDFQDWVDSYWAKDIQELFRLERRHAFQRLLELILARSGGIFEASAYARPCEVSRSTIANYLTVLEATYVVHVVRPFSGHRPTEIVSAPKVYGFDTGFVAAFRGLTELRPDDQGSLWEHYVLNEIQGRTQRRMVQYWRDKRGHEIDFIWARPGRPPIAIECKRSAGDFDPTGIRAFRHQHPSGDNLVVACDVSEPFTRTHAGLPVRFVDLETLIDHLERPAAPNALTSQ